MNMNILKTKIKETVEEKRKNKAWKMKIMKENRDNLKFEKKILRFTYLYNIQMTMIERTWSFSRNISLKSIKGEFIKMKIEKKEDIFLLLLNLNLGNEGFSMAIRH